MCPLYFFPFLSILLGYYFYYIEMFNSIYLIKFKVNFKTSKLKNSDFDPQFIQKYNAKKKCVKIFFIIDVQMALKF